MKELHILKFIKEHSQDWEALLTSPPYNLKIKRKDSYIIFNYGLFDSDMSLPLVQEARGIIFEEATWTPVRMAFTKFFNHGENGEAEIDWKTAKVQSKLDGSLISLWFHNGKWHKSSNGMIDAYEVSITGFGNSPTSEKFEWNLKSLGVIFDLAYHTGVDEGRYPNGIETLLNPKYCYTFEVCSPYNKVVVEWHKPLIFHIGTRNMETLEELNEDIGIPKPYEYPLKSISDVVAAANSLPENNEGYVVVDKNWNRIKIKSPWYVLNHHSITNSISLKKLFDIYKEGENEITEFLSYFPKYDETFEKIKGIVKEFQEELENEFSKYSVEISRGISKKEFYLMVKDSVNADFLIKKFTRPELSAFDYIHKKEKLLFEKIKKNLKM